MRRLKQRIEEELEDLRAEVSGVSPLFEKLSSREPDEIELRAAALTLHGFYNGVEAVFLLIAKRFDNHVPEGIRWHRQLLDDMKTSTKTREAVISQQDYDILLEYLSFRHIVRHTYPGTLSWDRFREIAQQLPQAHRRVEQRIRSFMELALTEDQ